VNDVRELAEVDARGLCLRPGQVAPLRPVTRIVVVVDRVPAENLAGQVHLPERLLDVVGVHGRGAVEHRVGRLLGRERLRRVVPEIEQDDSDPVRAVRGPRRSRGAEAAPRGGYATGSDEDLAPGAEPLDAHPPSGQRERQSPAHSEVLDAVPGPQRVEELRAPSAEIVPVRDAKRPLERHGRSAVRRAGLPEGDRHGEEGERDDGEEDCGARHDCRTIGAQERVPRHSGRGSISGERFLP
jgi:hypothetical protein